MDPKSQEQLAQQFREVRDAQARMVWKANENQPQPQTPVLELKNKKSSKKKSTKGKVLYPVAAAAVAALVMSPSVAAFADTARPPGEALPVHQVQTENSAIEQPKEQPKQDEPEQARSKHSILPNQENQVPRQVQTKRERPQPVRAESQNNQERKHLIGVFENKQQERSEENKQESKRLREENNNFFFTQQQEKQPERRVAPVASKPADEEQKAPQSSVKENESVREKTEQVSLPSSHSQKAKGTNESSAESKQSTSTKSDSPSNSKPEIEVKGKLPDTASPYPLQMLASGLVSLSGIAGLIWSRKKKW